LKINAIVEIPISNYYACNIIYSFFSVFHSFFIKLYTYKRLIVINVVLIVAFWWNSYQD